MEVKLKKKTLIFIPEFPRLTETFIEREVSKLIEFGNLDITVFSLRKASGKMSENVSKVVFYRRLDPITCLIAGFYFLFVKSAKLAEAFRLVVGKDRACFLKRYIVFLKGVGYAWLFKKYTPAHIHAHFLSDPSTIVMVAAKLLDVPFSVSGHARDVMVDGTLIPAKVRTAKFISICNKYAYKSCIEQSKVDNPRNVYQQYHGVDAAKLNAGVSKIPKPGRPLVFVGSRLVEKKGLSYVIDAAKILRDRGINHEVHIVGPGPMYARLIALIKKQGLEDMVFIHGKGKGLPWDEVVGFFKIADVFAHPSIDTSTGDVDGVPTFLVEAALTRVPIVTTAAGSITDLIIDEETGLLVPQRDALRLADAIERLIFDSTLINRVKEGAYQKAREMFDLDKNVRGLERLLLQD